MPLTPQQDLFCREYVARKFNGADAYRAAYPKSKASSARANAARLLANDSIGKRVSEIVQRAAADEGVTPAKVIRELGFIALQRGSQLYRPDGSMKPPGEWDEATDATVAGVEIEEEWVPDGAPADESRESQAHGGALKRSKAKLKLVRAVKVRRWDKRQALDTFMRHFGLLTEDAPHPDRPPVDLKALADDALDKLLAAVGPLLPPELGALGGAGEGAAAPAG